MFPFTTLGKQIVCQHDPKVFAKLNASWKVCLKAEFDEVACKNKVVFCVSQVTKTYAFVTNENVDFRWHPKVKTEDI